MRVEIHELFKAFPKTHEAAPRESVVHSMAAAPKLGDFLSVPDPELPLDWSGKSFLGLLSLREKILARRGYAAKAGGVLITAGTAEANFLAISQLVGPGDEMIVDVPGWPQPLVLGEAIGAKVIRLRRKEDLGWRLDLDELESLVTARTKLIFICNPNNPTGRVLEPAELARIVRIADKVGAYLLCDEVYAGLEWNGLPVPRAADAYDRGTSHKRGPSASATWIFQDWTGTAFPETFSASPTALSSCPVRPTDIQAISALAPAGRIRTA